MNNSLKLDININSIKQLLPMLAKVQVYIYGLAVIVIFGYTAYTVNQELNVQPASSQSAITALPPIKFNNSTMTQLKSLNNVQGQVPLGSLGTSNPF